MTLELIDRLLAADAADPKHIAVIGDSMLDAWATGEVYPCQDGCLNFSEERTVLRPGGAANAAVSLGRWRSQVYPLMPEISVTHPALHRRFLLTGGRPIIKKRFLDQQGRIVFRNDCDGGYGLSDLDAQGWRRQILMYLKTLQPDAVLLCDYDKGIFDRLTMQEIIAWCQERDIPVVADAKRYPGFYQGAILKANSDYAQRWLLEVTSYSPAAIITHGSQPPVLLDESGIWDADCAPPAVVCVNHVGAGDCFAAHLTLALAHGLTLQEAVIMAHHAGRVYVQAPYNRPPWPHEIRKDIDPVGGKRMEGTPDRMRTLQACSATGRVVFTNGVFRLFTAGHAWLLDWAKQQGDVLVVGVNDDASARRLRGNRHVLPLAERVHLLASQKSVDWIVPFADDDPCALISALQPDVLVKGHEYAGQRVPGDELVKDVRFAPASPFPAHATDLETAVRAG